MASKAQKVQTNFNAGILSPYIEGRPDLAQYFNGALQAKNVILLPEGGFENSPGTGYKGTTKNNDQAILVPFQPTEDHDFYIEMGIGYMRFYKDGELIKSGGAELITNGGFDTDLSSWTDNSPGSASASWDGGRLVLTPELAIAGFNIVVANQASIFQTITTVAGQVHTVTFTILSGTPLMNVLDGDGVTLLSTGTYPPGVYSVTFTAASTVTSIIFVSGASIVSCFIDDVSCKLQATTPYEISSPFTLDDLMEIKGGQGLVRSVDVLFICCSRLAPLELQYGGDTNWTLRYSPFAPMPSYEADTDISGGTATLTPGATTGSGINFTASSGVFLEGDAGRVIKYGTSRAWISSVTNSTTVVCEILTAFPDTNPIPATLWLLEGSPANATLDVPFKKPINRTMTAVANVATFRTADVGKFIKTYGGLLEILKFISATQVSVKIWSILNDSDKDNPDAAPAGSWTLEVAAWSDALGWPTLNEFFQGRYILASNNNQRTTIWGSQTNDFYNFAVGALATDAFEYTHRSGNFSKMKWAKENGSLFFADGFGEHSLKGQGVDQPIGGDTVPFQKPESHNGSAAMRPIHVGNSLLYLNWSQRKILASTYNFERDAQIAKIATFLTRDLSSDFIATADNPIDPGFDNHAPAYVEEPLPAIYWRRNDGVLLVQSYNDDPEGGNNGWTTLELDGNIESLCVTRRDNESILTLIVKREINGITKRYIEEMRHAVLDPNETAWPELQSQAAVVLVKADSAAQSVFTGLDHLEGETVDISIYKWLINATETPRYMGRKTVSGGQITLDETIDYPAKLEIGIPFIPLVKTMRPAIPQQPTEAHLRRWTKCFLRLRKSGLAVVNGTDMYEQRGFDVVAQGPYLRSGDIAVDTSDADDAAVKKWDWSLDGYIEITRNKPYPLRVLMLMGEVEFSQSMAEATINEAQINVP